MIQTFIATIDGWCAGSDKITIEDVQPYEDWLAYPPNGGGTPIVGVTSGLYWIGIGGVNTSLYVDPAFDPSGRYLSRVGGWVRVYANNVPQGLWMILADGPSSDVGFGEGLIISPVSGADTISMADTPSVRLEDPYKLVTTIPDWIPEDSEAYERWIPVVTEFSASFGQSLDLKGGVASVDGQSFSVVMDPDEPSLERLFRIRPEAWRFVDQVTGVEAENALNKNVNDSATSIEISYSFDGDVQNGDLQDFTHPPSFEDLIAVDKFPFLSETSSTPRVVEPMFVGTEGIWLDESSPETSDEFFWVYDVVERHCASTARIPQRRLGLCFDGLPSPIGAVVRTWTHAWAEQFTSGGFVNRFSGLISNIDYRENLSAADFTLDPLLLSATIASSLVTRTPSEIKRPTVPQKLTIGDRLKFRSKFITRQRNPEDKFRWVKISGIIFPMVKRRNANYATINGEDRNRFQRQYGLEPGRGATASEVYRDQIEIEEATGLTDAFYYLGTSQIEVEQVIATQNRTQQGLPPFNQFATSDPEYYRFSAFRVEDISDFDTWNAKEQILAREEFTRVYAQDLVTGLTEQQVKDEVKSWSDQDPEIAHLFEPWCVGIGIPADSPQGYEWAWYDSKLRVGGGPSIRGVYISTHPVDIILQVLTSTGTGTYDLGVNTPGWNGPFDMLPSEFGYGIPIEQVRLETFERAWRSIGSASTCKNAYMTIEDDPIDWLSEQILEPYLLAIGTDTEGRIVLVDLADFRESIDSYPIPSTAIVKPTATSPINVGGKTEYTDVADSFAYKWSEPWTPFTSFNSRNTYIVQGQAARSVDGRIVSANIFSRIQRDPVTHELNWAIPIAGAFGIRVQNYLTAYRRTLSKVTFTTALDNDLYLGRNVVFQLPYLPSENGDFSYEPKTFVAKVVDSRADLRTGIQEIECLVYGETSSEKQTLWNLTALVTSVSGDSLEVADNYFIVDPIREIFAFDWSVFQEGDEVTIWTKNWVKVIDTTLVDITRAGGVTTFTVGDSGSATADCRITLRRREGTTSDFVNFFAWHRNNQRLQ